MLADRTDILVFLTTVARGTANGPRALASLLKNEEVLRIARMIVEDGVSVTDPDEPFALPLNEIGSLVAFAHMGEAAVRTYLGEEVRDQDGRAKPLSFTPTPYDKSYKLIVDALLALAQVV